MAIQLAPIHTSALASRLDRIIEETGFSGVVHVADAEHVRYARAAGWAERAHRIPNTLDTQFAIASGTKALTALAVMSLVADEALALDATVSPLLGPHQVLVDRAVTVRHLLAHTSGMGDYLDESAIADIEDYVLEIPVHRLACPTDFLPLLRARPPKFPPGTSFAYCNSGYVLLALLIEVVSGRSYYDVVQQRVCAPAGMDATAFLRLDELPGCAAIGYLPKRGWRTNHLHVPVRGGGDGGAYSTAADIARLWAALFAEKILPSAVVRQMIQPQHDVGPTSRPYGLGFWLSSAREVVGIEGSDPGISFRSSFEPSTGALYTVLSNTTAGAWPVARELEALLSTPTPGASATSP
jgi:CubicO group peptidase (beta-lactamase class C family)